MSNCRQVESNLLKAIRIVGELQEWLVEELHDDDTEAGLTWTPCSLQVFVGGVTVWLSGKEWPNALTLSKCQRLYLKEIHVYQCFKRI